MKNKLGIYITVQNAIERDYPFEECIQSACYVADEVVVVDGGSTDGTLERLLKLVHQYPSKMVVYHNKWDATKRNEMLAIQKTYALNQVQSEWAMLLDADEVLHESSYEWIRQIVESANAPKTILGYICDTLHFYKNYNTINTSERFYRNKVYIIRNHCGITHGWFGDDPDNHITAKGEEVRQYSIKTNIPIFHYGHVKSSKEIYEEKFNRMESMWHEDWKHQEFTWDMDSYRLYNMSHPKWMRDRIQNFTEIEL